MYLFMFYLPFSFENVLYSKNYYSVDNDHPLIFLMRRRHQAWLCA